MELLEFLSSKLTDILGLKPSPVAIKFILQGESLPPGFTSPEGVRYCQVLMKASEGESVLLAPEHIACPASAAALGYRPLPEKLQSGEMLTAYGIFANREAAQNTLDTIPRLTMGQYQAVAACPLADAPFVPDVVVLESVPEHLMWIALAHVRTTGGRLNFSTGILQATCVDGTILPFLEQRMNASLGCYGCREATDMSESECILGFPFKYLTDIVRQLEELQTKSLARVRGKAVFHALERRT
ncbi:MAG: DUF169 domain-containing protein [Anaerolineae bacterium]